MTTKKNSLELVPNTLQLEAMATNSTPGANRIRAVEQNKRDLLRILIRGINRTKNASSGQIVSLPEAKLQANSVLAEILKEYPHLLQPEVLIGAKMGSVRK
jgi:hypothetical protein